MKKINVIGIILSFAISAFVTGCDNAAEGGILMSGYTHLDTLISSGSHVLSFKISELDFPKYQGSPYIGICEINDKDESVWGEFDISKDNYHLWNNRLRVWVKPESDLLIIEVLKNPYPKMRRLTVAVSVHHYQQYSHTYLSYFNFTQEGADTDGLEESMEVKMRYKKRVYSSRVIFGENDSIIYENPEVTELIAYLSERKDVETIVTGNAINFFDSEDTEAQAEIKGLFEPKGEVRWMTTRAVEPEESCCMISRGSLNPFRSRAAYVLGFCGLFDDTGYSDTEIHYNLFDFNESRDVYKMKECYQDKNLNDKVSSLAVYYGGADSNVCAVLTVWEDSDFNYGDNDRTKHRVSFVATANDREVEWENLKKLPCLNSGDSWNDRISSMSFHFGNVGKYLADY